MRKMVDSCALTLCPSQQRSRMRFDCLKKLLSRDVFKQRTLTGRDVFALLLCLDATKFQLLIYIVFSRMQTICQNIWAKPLPKKAKMSTSRWLALLKKRRCLNSLLSRLDPFDPARLAQVFIWKKVCPAGKVNLPSQKGDPVRWVTDPTSPANFVIGSPCL